MASTCTSIERETYEELEDPLESDGTPALRSWQGRQAVHSSSCPWRAEILTRTRTTHYSSKTSRRTMTRDLIWNLRHVVERIEGSPQTLSSLQTHERDELDALVRIVQEFVANRNRDQSDEPKDEHRLIDWRAINRRQWETGMQATLGEDGEPLATLERRLRVQHTLEDDYEETLPE